jgi:hypothetical protein
MSVIGGLDDKRGCVALTVVVPMDVVESNVVAEIMRI